LDNINSTIQQNNNNSHTLLVVFPSEMSVFEPALVIERVASVRKQWLSDKDNAKSWKGADALLIVQGKHNDDIYSKTRCFQKYILNYGK